MRTLMDFQRSCGIQVPQSASCGKTAGAPVFFYGDLLGGAWYAEDWKSEITLWVNGVECATWCCPGDFGSRRGRLTPPLWPNGSTQYGILVKWEIKGDGTYINGERASKVRISDIGLSENAFVTMIMGNKKSTKYEGGFNLFGKTFGDYPQDILMEIEY